MKYISFFLMIFILALVSCKNPEQENRLQQREADLRLKEQQFAEKEQEFEQLKQMRDSLEKLPDTVVVPVLPAAIIGRYNGKMVCTESDCAEHVIGDVRNDVWEISADGAKIINKSGSERLYTGKYADSEFKLKSEPGNNPAVTSEITLQLPENFSGRLKGTRELRRENCISRFSVDLEKIKN